MMAIIGMFFQDGLTGSAWGDWANYTASPLRAFENELGVQAPVGFLELVESLCKLFQCIEQNAKWPSPMTKGAVTFIPKEHEDEFLTPDKYRPITILSSIYRLWSAVRHDQLASLWFPYWRHPQCFGSKGCQSADQLAYQTCQQLQQAQRDQLSAAGVSFDLAKCFDSVPIALALDVLQFRGAPPAIVKCVRSFYQHHTKFFKLDGHYMTQFKPTNGLVQGCPLSMLIVSALVSSWLEYTEAHIATAVCRSYADDLSGIVQDANPKQVKTGLQQIYQSTKKFTQLAGLNINMKKTFTFGPMQLWKSKITTTLSALLVVPLNPLHQPTHGLQLKKTGKPLGNKPCPEFFFSLKVGSPKFKFVKVSCPN